MDDKEPSIGSTRAHLPAADTKIVFDKFHIAQHANEAVDKVRRQENRALNAEGHNWLVGTKFEWLRHSARLSIGATKVLSLSRSRPRQPHEDGAARRTPEGAAELWVSDARLSRYSKCDVQATITVGSLGGQVGSC